MRLLCRRGEREGVHLLHGRPGVPTGITPGQAASLARLRQEQVRGGCDPARGGIRWRHHQGYPPGWLGAAPQGGREGYWARLGGGERAQRSRV